MTYRFQAEIKAEHLRAMAHLAAVSDVRHYLKGLQVAASPSVLDTFADQRCSGGEELLALQEAEAALRAWGEAQRAIPSHLQPENIDA